MARTVAFVPDLLFGSNLVGALQAGSHDVALVAKPEDLEGALAGADVLIVDLTADPDVRIEAARPFLGSERPRTLAFFAHVERDVRADAERAGFDLVVPRSRLARSASELVDQLTTS
ncbi:MAG: hypothetical protein ABI323_10215 [Solirubrobacteraceae bacterium]